MALAVGLLLAGCGGVPTTWYARQGSVLVGVYDCPRDSVAKALLAEWLASTPPPDSPPATAVQTTDIATLLPGAGAVGRWEVVTGPKTVEGARLSMSLGPSAGHYAAFGLGISAWAEYGNPALGGRAMLRIDIFDMGSPENAFGLYSQRRVPQGEIKTIGAQAYVGARDVLAWVDRFVYTVTIYNYSTDTAEALIAFAEHVGRHTVGVESPPSLVTAVPSARLMRFSHRWFRTAAQRATAATHPGFDAFAIPEGSRGFVAKLVVAERQHADAFYVAFPSEADAERALAALRAGAGAGADVRDAKIGVESFRIRTNR
jgi:hypothetical protein